MATIWLTIVDMGNLGTKMEQGQNASGTVNSSTPLKNNTAANAPRNNAPANAPRNNAPANVPKNNTPNARKNNKPRNGARSPRLPEPEEGANAEAAIPNASVAATAGSNNNSRRSSNANSIEPEVDAVEVDPPTTGGRRRRKSRKGRKSRKSRK